MDASSSLTSLASLESTSTNEKLIQEKRLTTLLKKLLECFADTDEFSEARAPTFFVVYAHENTSTGKADAALVRDLIKWLSILRSKIVSDRTLPTNWYTHEDGNVGRDILSNQFCLLPKNRNSGRFYNNSSVDKVVLCYSEVLQSYYKDDRSKKYIESIKDFYFHTERDLEDTEEVKKGIERIVKEHCSKEGFHHVITEMAFLEIRAMQEQKRHGIIPIILHEDGIEIPSFLDIGVPLRVKPQKLSESMIHECQVQHRLLFKLLRQLCGDKYASINAFEDCYKKCTQGLVLGSSLLSETEFECRVTIEAKLAVDRLTRDSLATYRTSKDQTAIGHGNVHWILPRALNTLFTGRDELLLRIQKALRYNHTSSPNKQKRFVITGLGGQGKSEICLKIANELRQEFWGVFWVTVDKPSTAKNDFITIAKCLGHSIESIPEALQILASTKESWLLILDNADDPDFDYQVYIPSGNYGAVLITSRVAKCKRYSPDATEALEGLEPEDAKKLLLQAAELPPQSWPSYDRAAEEVVRLLGSHTLGLILAGAYIANGHCRLSKYPHEYRRQRKRLLKYRLTQDQSRYSDIYATFEASAEALALSGEEVSKDALQLLDIISMLSSSVLPLQLFEDAWSSSMKILNSDSLRVTGINEMSRNHVSYLPGFLQTEEDEWDSYRLIEAKNRLVSLSLVIQHDLDESIGLSMHPLAHDWAREREKQRGEIWITTGCILALSRSNNSLWQMQEARLLPHVLSYLDIEVHKALLFRSEAIIVPILLQCGRALLFMRQDNRLSYLLKDVFHELDQDVEQPYEKYLPLYKLQARNLFYLGKSKRAVALLEQVVKIEKTTLAETHPDWLASQYILAGAYEANGQIEEAVALLEQVVKIQKTTLAETHPDWLASQYILAGAYKANGQTEEAVKLLERVVKIPKTMLAETHPDWFVSQHELARAYKANGQIEEAVTLLEYVVKIQQTTLAKTHPSRLVSRYALARAYEANGQVGEAVALYGI